MLTTTIAIFGAGAVGTTTAYALMLANNAAKIMLVDVNDVRCTGEVQDLSDALPFCKTSEIYRATPQEAARADIIIICAGMPQKPGQARTELVTTNLAVTKSICASLGKINPNALVIVVTNPLDTLTLCVQECLGLPRSQIIGTGTFLDTQRLRGHLAKKLGVAYESVDAYVLGEHGDSQCVMWSSVDVGGVPLEKIAPLSAQEKNEIAEKTRKTAYEIIAAKGATFFGIAACVAEICTAIIFDKKVVIPLSCYQQESGICLSMPVVLGARGIEKIVPVDASQDEQKALAASVQKLQALKAEYGL